ncbi:MAG: OmpA family protein [Bacteroidales bacterium]|nr:OmpA family protein [Bacteroidales bacterium]
MSNPERITKLILWPVLILTGMAVAGQNVDFKTSSFKDQKEELKKVIEKIETADQWMEKGLTALLKDEGHSYSFILARDLYLEANAFNPSNAELNYKIGKCIIHTSEKTASVPYFEKAIELDPGVSHEAFLLLAKAYKYDYRFDEAAQILTGLKSRLGGKYLELFSPLIKKELEECSNAMQFIANPSRVWLDKLPEINTVSDDYSAGITADESMMVLNSRREGSTGGAKNDNDEWFADIYVSTKTERGWTEPKKIGEALNSDVDDEAVALSPDGQMMFLARDNTGNLDLYKSELRGQNWSSPVELAPHRINSEYNESGASFSADGIKIFFVSDNPYANRGGADLYFSGRINTRHVEEWGNASTVGKEVNTPYNEGSVFIHPDGNTLFFSSQGFNSMGGYDIFKCTRLPGRWSEPVNLGYPVNTPYDEKYISVSASGKHGYVSSNRKEDSEGGYDIFRVTFLGPEKPMTVDREDQLISSITRGMRDSRLEAPVEIEANHLTVLRGHIFDEFTREPVEAEIEIVDNVKNEIITTLASNSTSGKFLISLPAGINYGIAIKAEGYLFYSENFDLPAMSDYQLLTKDIFLQNICIGCKIILRNIFFDTGKFTLKPESNPELERLFKLMNDVPRLKVEISGHTDNVGGDEANRLLSENRAKAVVTYLTGRGIDPGRITFRGYGPSQPVASNETAAGKQLNRRTEFKIVEN